MAMDPSQLVSPEKPSISKMLAVKLAEKHFELHVIDIQEFDSYGDRNFYLKAFHRPTAKKRKKLADEREFEFVLKILNYVDSRDKEMVEAQNEAMLFLKNRGISCAFPIPSRGGTYNVYEECSSTGRGNPESSKANAIRLMQYIPGALLKDLPSLTSALLFDFGQYIGHIDKHLKGYSHPRLDQSIYIWDLQHMDKLEPYVKAKYLGTKAREDILKTIYEKYMSIVPKVVKNSVKQTIHNDLNEHNVLLREDLWGVIDFGDMCYSYRLFDISIAMSHLMVLQFVRGDHRAVSMVGRLLLGYQSVFPLSGEELKCVYWAIAGRFLQILVLDSIKISLEPGNEHLTDDHVYIWNLLPGFLKIGDHALLEKWMEDGVQAGFTVCPIR